MKAYKLIFNLLRHPFAKVKLLLGYNLTHIRYNEHSKEYLLESITDNTDSQDDKPIDVSPVLGIKIALLDCNTCASFNKKCRPYDGEFNPDCEKYFKEKPKEWVQDSGEKNETFDTTIKRESKVEALDRIARQLRESSINKTNKALYDKAFVSWRNIPMIDRSNVEDWSQSKEEGEYIPATAIGERDYIEAHLEGLQNIFKSSFKVQFFPLEMLDNWTLDSCPVELYDNIQIGDKDVIVTKITDKEILFSDRKGNLYSHNWKKENE